MLEIGDLRVSTDGKEIIKGVSLAVKPGEVHVLMGPNGSGKSTLALALAGHPRYKVTSGEAVLDGKNLVGLKPHKRARLGLFLAMQHPVAISGVSTANFLRTSLSSLKKRSPKNFLSYLKGEMKELRLDEQFAFRAVNDGFSGGEKKKLESLQLEILNPKYAILDEPDSGLDIDALQLVAEKINRAAYLNTAILLITHYQRILKYIKANFVHVLVDGKIIKSGSHKLAQEIEEKGYIGIKNEK